MKRIVLLSVLALAAAACNKGQAAPAAKSPTLAEAPRPVAVTVAEVDHRKMPKHLVLTGSVLADKQSEVAANVAGRIANTYVERGQPVKEGQVLARVDAKAAGFQAQAATAQSQAAETQVAQAKSDCERADQLFEKGAVTKAEYERQRAACTAQLYQANAARAQADLAGKLAGDTIIRAPIDGVVGERFVNVGEYVQPSTRIASVFSVSTVRVSISVPEPVVGQVREGQTLELEVSAYPGRRFPATVKFVSPTLRPSTRDLIVEAEAANADGALRPGMFATVLLLAGEELLPTVPAEAIKSDGTIRRLWIAKEGFAHEMVVRTGVTQDGRVAVHEPLEKGEQVVVAPPPGLRDGTPLQLSSAQ